MKNHIFKGDKNMNIEFGLCATELSEQLKEFNLPKETVDVWQGIADFIISAHISKAINDKAFYKCNQLLGSDISKTIKEINDEHTNNNQH